LESRRITEENSLGEKAKTQNQTLRTLKKPESTEQGKDLKNAIIRLEFLSFVPLRVLGG
jgi:hypothetical protein